MVSVSRLAALLHFGQLTFEKDSARKKKILRGRSVIAMKGEARTGGRSEMGISGSEKHIIIAVRGRSTGPARNPVNEYLISFGF